MMKTKKIYHFKDGAMRRGHYGRERIVGIRRDQSVADLQTGPYLFIQTRSNKNKFHAPGMRIVTKDWIYDLAQKNNWGVSKVFREKVSG
jgi:hypothetical protein